MSIWNKVLVGLIGVAALVFFYLAARTLQTHAYWRNSAQNFEQALTKARQSNIKLAEGEPAQPGIRQVRAELDKLLMDRRRVWFNCDPKVDVRREGGTAEIAVAIDQPAPHGIADSTVLYAFEEVGAENRGRYLGEFKATKSDAKQVTLEPTSKLTTRELDRLAVAKRPWTLYEILPRDNHETFAKMDEARKKAILPAGSVQEYRKDGQPAAQDDPQEQVADGKYVRMLRDYHVLFEADNASRILMDELFATTMRDKRLVDDALAQAQQQETACQKDIANAKQELAQLTRESNWVASLSKAISQKLAEVLETTSRLIEKNQAMAGQIAHQQLEASRRIDERTRAMAQNGTGG